MDLIKFETLKINENYWMCPNNVQIHINDKIYNCFKNTLKSNIYIS